MLQGIERYLKQAIVDKNASVSSASLVSALVSWFMVLCVSPLKLVMQSFYKTYFKEFSISILA